MTIPFDMSPNFKTGRKGGKIDYIVMHAMSGWFQGTIDWFKNPKSQVSAHYLISKRGEVVQMVRDQDTAWHVVNANSYCLGIELEDASWSTPDAKGKKFVRDCETDPNWFTVKEIDAAAQLVVELLKTYSLPLTSVIGHNDPILQRVGNNHKDPGPFFPWSRFRQMIQDKMETPKE